MPGANPSASSPEDFYSPVNKSLFITDIFDWYWLPKNEHESVLVASVTASAATYWVIAYTILVGLTFTAVCGLVTLAILSFFRVGNSGNRHAILVAYYNAGSPSRTIPLMLGYLRNALFKCQRGGRWAIDWPAFGGSALLFFITFSLFSGDMITKFFLGGAGLIQGSVAQVNPAAVFYPDFNSTDDGTGQNKVRAGIFEALKGPRSLAVHQAISRKASAGKNLKSRINYHGKIVTQQDGSSGAEFSYSYQITGYEMGLRDAAGLVFAVRGSCATYHGTVDGVVNGFFNFYNTTDTIHNQEEYELYPFFGDWNYSAPVIPGRENFTAPWALFAIKYDNITLAENEEFGGWTFQIVPHTSRRVSFTQRLNDPWYETEPNPGWVEGFHEQNEYNGPFRVKGLRPPLRCTQNDTYTYGGMTVNHINKLDQLPGLKLSPLIRKFVFGMEFGAPVFAHILGYVPFGSLASTIQFIPNERRLDAQRASILDDFEGLVETAFAYSREVVRNMALLFPSQEGIKDSVLMNAALNGTTTGIVPPENADFLLSSSEVAALSVVTLITTPCVCAFMWILVFIWNRVSNPRSRLDNTSAKGRQGLRYHALQAVHLYRYLDEELSRKRKWSGRISDTPYIRDLDNIANQQTDFEGSVKFSESGQVIEVEHTVDLKSEYPQPKLVPVDIEGPRDLDSANAFERMKIWIVGKIFGTKGPRGEQFEVAMTRVWNPDISQVSWRDVRRNV